MPRRTPTFRRLRRLGAALGLGLSLSGCMTAAALYQAQEQKELERLRVFDPAQHDRALAPGAPVTGRLILMSAFRRRTGGAIERAPVETLTCEDLPIRLIPDTPHMRWLMQWRFDLKVEARGDWRRGRLSNPDEWTWPEPASVGFVQEALCGPDGAFTFLSGAPGRHLVLAKLHPTADRAPWEPYDLVLQPVEIRPDAPLEIHIRSDDWLAGPLLPR